MDVILDVVVLFALVIALSFLIERFLEVLKAIFDLLDSKMDWTDFWTDQTKKLRNRLEKRLKIFEYLDRKQVASALHRFRELLLNEQGMYSGNLPVLSGDLVRAMYVRIVSTAIGILLGIGFAFWLNIDLIIVWMDAAGPFKNWVEGIGPGLRIILSGIIIGLGSGPVHKIIVTMERKKQKKELKGVQP